MKKVFITIDKKRFEHYHTEFPSDWEVTYYEYRYPYDEDAMIKAYQDFGAEYAFVGSAHPYTRKFFETCSCKLLHVEGVGFNEVDVQAAKEHGVPVCNNRAVNNIAVAEHTIGLILAAMRRTALCNQQILETSYMDCKKQHFAEGEHELYGCKIGLVGAGAIGKEVARRLIGWGVEVFYYDVISLGDDAEETYQLKRKPFDYIISECDIISAHVPALPSTMKMFNKEVFSKMKPNAFFINTARGEIVDQEALVDALETGKIAGAAIDTLEPDDPTPDLKLFHLSEKAQSKLTITPHIAGVTDEAFIRMHRNALANFERVEKGEKPLNQVNL